MKKVNTIVIIISVLLILFIPLLLSYSMKDTTIWAVLVIYSGTIIGGLITLLGVVYSIKTVEREKTRDLELVYRPVLKIETSKEEPDRNILITCNNESYDDNTLILGKTTLQIKNIGRGEMQEIRIRNIKVDSIQDIIPYAEGNLDDKEEINVLGINESLYIGIKTPKNKISDTISTLYNVSMIVEYYGILNKTNFQNRVSFTVSINNKNKCEIDNIKTISM